MSMEVSGGVELREDIASMADLLRTSGENGSRACSWILQNAAQPVLEQMLHNASTDPKRRTGTLLRSIKIGRVLKKRSGGYRVTVGIHRKDAARRMEIQSNSAMAARIRLRRTPSPARRLTRRPTKPTKK